MELSFSASSLRSLCEKSSKAKGQLGDEAALNLRTYLADLVAADHLEEFLGMSVPDKITSTEDNFRLDLGHGLYLHFTPGHQVRPEGKGGRLNMAKVTRVKITNVGKQ